MRKEYEARFKSLTRTQTDFKPFADFRQSLIKQKPLQKKTSKSSLSLQKFEDSEEQETSETHHEASRTFIPASREKVDRIGDYRVKRVIGDSETSYKFYVRSRESDSYLPVSSLSIDRVPVPAKNFVQQSLVSKEKLSLKLPTQARQKSAEPKKPELFWRNLELLRQRNQPKASGNWATNSVVNLVCQTDRARIGDLQTDRQNPRKKVNVVPIKETLMDKNFTKCDSRKPKEEWVNVNNELMEQRDEDDKTDRELFEKLNSLLS